jgi:TonB family protein
MEVTVAPDHCVIRDPGPKSPQCAEPIRFEWAHGNSRISYPPILIEAGVGGRVLGSIWVSTSGGVDSVTTTASSNAQFTAKVKEALVAWRFRAPPSGLNAVQRRLSLEILFRLGGCPDPGQLPQRVVALHTGMLVEVLGCQITYTKSISGL